MKIHMSTGKGAVDKQSELKSSTANAHNSNGNVQPLCTTYPVNSIMELTLAPNREVVRGLIYTTDEISNSIVLKRSLKHTTLASEIRICNAASVIGRTIIRMNGATSSPINAQNSNTPSEEGGNKRIDKALHEKSAKSNGDSNDNDVYSTDLDVTISPLPVVSKKALDEREKRAMRLADESFAQINQKVSPAGQAVFDRLLKACNEVAWKGESIYVLNQIRVDPPYSKDDCKHLTSSVTGGSLNEGSLDRVKKIVGSSVGV